MTLDDLKAVDREYLLPREVAEIIGTDPHSVRVAARLEPERLGFPVIVVGTRIKIPRIPFLKHMGVDV